MKFGIRPQALLLTLVPLAFLLAVLVTAGILQQRLQRSSAAIEHASHVLAISEEIVRSLTETNAAAAAYTRRPSGATLAAYHEAAAVLPRELVDLRSSVRGDRAQTTNAQRLARASRGLVAIINEYVDDVRAGRKREAAALIGSARTRAASPEFLAARSKFDMDERQVMIGLFVAQRRDVQSFDRLLFAVSIVGVAVTLVLAGAFGVRLARRLSRLAENARRLGDGLPAQAIPGTDEIATIDRVYKEMAERIAATALEREKALEAYRSEHLIASRLQRALLPQELHGIPGVRFDGVYEPGANASVGGDWYDAVRLADGRVLISIGDVAGKGLEAAVVMSSMRQVIRGVAQVYADPAAMIDAADRTLRAEYCEKLVTAFVGVFDPVAATLAYCCAGHPPPLVRGPDGAIAALTARGLPLGLRQRNESDEDARTVTLAEGSLVVFYTDGLIESRRDVIAGERQLREALARIDGRAPGVARSLYEALLAEGAGDDVAILAMRIDGAPEADPHARCFRSRWDFDARDAVAGQDARHAFTRILRQRGVSDDGLMTAELIFGELVSNTVRYASGPIAVVLDWEPNAAVLHVLDRGAGFVVMPRLPIDIMSENGRGLFLIRTLAEEFNVTKRADGGSHARVVLSLRAPQPTAALLA